MNSFKIKMIQGLLILVLGVASVGAIVLPDGSLDTSFNSSGIVQTAIPGFNTIVANGVYVHYDGTITVCGNQEAFVSPEVFFVVQYLPNGTLNTAFGNNGIATIELSAGSAEILANGIAMQSDGKIVVVGTIIGTTEARESLPEQGNNQMFVARLTAAGALDTTFNGTGINLVPKFSSGSSDSGNAVVIDVEGRVVAVGTTEPLTGGSEMAVARFTPTGILDITFGGTGQVSISFGAVVPQDQGFAVALAADGQTIYAAGSSTNTPGASGPIENFAFAQVSPTGTVALTKVFPFAATMPDIDSISTECHAILVQPNGDLVLVGFADWTPDNGNNYFALARCDSAGNLDTSFVGSNPSYSLNPGTFVSPSIGSVDQSESASAFGAALQSDGKIIAVGEGPNTDSEFFMMSARYSGTHGDLDTTYNGGSAPAGFVWTAANNLGAFYGFNAVALQSPATGATNGYIVGAGFAGQQAGSGTPSDISVVRYVVDDPFVPLQLPEITPPVLGGLTTTITGIAQNPSIVDIFMDSVSDTGQLGSTVTIGSTPNWAFTTGPISGSHTFYAVGRYRDDGHVNLLGTMFTCSGQSPTGYYSFLVTNLS